MFLRYFENKFYRASFVLPIDYGTNEQSVTKQLISELGQQCDKVWNCQNQDKEVWLQFVFTQF